MWLTHIDEQQNNQEHVSTNKSLTTYQQNKTVTAAQLSVSDDVAL